MTTPKIGDTFTDIDVPQQGGTSVKRNVKVVSVYPEEQKVAVRTDAGGNAIITFDALNNINENKKTNKMQFTKTELQNLIKEEVQRKKLIEELEIRKIQLLEEFDSLEKDLNDEEFDDKEFGVEKVGAEELAECGMGMEEHGDGIGLGVNHLVDEEERLGEDKDSVVAKTKKV